MAVSGPGGVWGRPALGLFGGAAGGGIGLGDDRRAPAAGDFWPVLAGRGPDFGPCRVACKKIIKIFENFICILGKMGYNMVEWLPNASAASRRCNSWQSTR